MDVLSTGGRREQTLCFVTHREIYTSNRICLQVDFCPRRVCLICLKSVHWSLPGISSFCDFFGSLWSHGLTFQHSINSVYKVINHQTTGNKTSLSSQVIFFLFPFSHFVYCSPSNFWDGVLQTAVCIIPWAWFLGYISFLKQIGTPWYIIPSLSNSQGGTELKWLRQFAKAISLPNARSVLEHTAVKRKCLHFYGFSYEVSGNRTEYLLL